MASGEIVQTDANSGEPSFAIALMNEHVRNIELELASGNSHVWLRHDLSTNRGYLIQMHFGFLFPSLGDAASAVRLARSRYQDSRDSPLRDEKDAREKAYRLMQRCAWLPALSQADPQRGWGDYAAISTAMREVEASAQPGSFDSFDYGTLSVGGAYAARMLGQPDRATQITVQALAERFGPAGSAASATIAHLENTLRLQLVLLGRVQIEAAEIATSYHRRWPFSLLLHADLVKFLALIGRGSEAAAVLSEMPSCEYRRRIERELKNLKFFD